MQVTTIGLDIAKNVFQVHGIDAAEKVVVRRQLRRRQVLEFFKALPPCLVGMEACATAHYWARELTKLGHQVRLMPAKDVKAYVKRNKNDAADAEAICEAVRRPTMRFVQIKSTEQQGRLMLHRARDLLMRQRTQVINAMRAHLAELGIVAAQGRDGIKELLKIIASEEDARLPVDAHASLVVLAAGLQAVQTMIGSIEKRIMVQHRSNEASQRLETIPGIGVIAATRSRRPSRIRRFSDGVVTSRPGSGVAPRLKVSMTFMRPPQHGHGVGRLVEGLPDQGARPLQDHNAQAGRVYPPLPHASCQTGSTGSGTTVCWRAAPKPRPSYGRVS